jgi:hypothetical protein
VFQASGVLTPAAWLMACIIGAAALPAAFLARWIVPRMSATVHITVLDLVVVVGALVLIARALG